VCIPGDAVFAGCSPVQESHGLTKPYLLAFSGGTMG